MATVQEVRAAINASPALKSLLTNESAIASEMSRTRKKLASRLIGEATLCEAIGIPEGPVFVRRLREASALPLSVTLPLEKKATMEQIVRLLERGTLDIAVPVFRTAFDAFVADGMLTQAQSNTIKALAEAPDPVDEFTVRQAIWNNDGSRAL